MRIYKLNLDVDNYESCFIEETNISEDIFDTLCTATPLSFGNETVHFRRSLNVDEKVKQEYLKLVKMQTLKLKAAEALKTAGVINEDELAKLQADLDKLINEKGEFMAKLKAESEAKAEEKSADDTEKPVEEESIDSLAKKAEAKASAPKKTTTKKSTVGEKKTPAKKTTKSATAKKTTTKSKTTADKSENKTDKE